MPISPFNQLLIADQPNPKIYYGDAPPASGSKGYAVGDLVINIAPGGGEAVAWQCTNAATPVFVPIVQTGSLTGTPLAITAAGTVTGTPGKITTSGFAGNVTLASAALFADGFEFGVWGLSTHSVTLVAASGNAIIGLNGAITSATAAAVFVASGGTNWYRVS